MRSAILLGLIVAATGGACSSGDPHASPEAAMRAFVAAGNAKDVGAMRAVAIAPERLARAIACPPDDHKIDRVEAVADARQTMHERAGMGVRILSIVEVSRRSVAAGDGYSGCQATEPFELRHLRMNLSVDDGAPEGRQNRSGEGDAILLDGRWWLVIPSP
jgi:hypothetical protein